MASDSLFGGGTDLSDVVSSESLNLINAFLTDSVGGTAKVSDVGGGTMVISTGGNGETQGALLPGSSAITGTIDDGVLSLDVQLPAGLGVLFEGKNDLSPEGVGSFLNSIIDSYLPPGTPGTESMRESLNAAVNDLVASIQALGVSNVTVRMIDFMSTGGPTNQAFERQEAAAALKPNEILLGASSSGSGELFAINLNGLNKDKTLVLSGLENIMLVGQGTVRVDGNTSVTVSSDGGSQNIIGGGGNDTLIGGGGNDTLAGGAGNDVFGFVRFGHFTINDFSAGDKLAFKVPGITNVSQLVPYLTKVSATPEATSLEFGSSFSITLVGVSASDITADLIKFTF
jgi:hypothetical protein